MSIRQRMGWIGRPPGVPEVGGGYRQSWTDRAIAAALLLLTGISWIASLRGCLRAVWGLEPDRGNPLVRKALDGGVLLGLGGVGLASLVARPSPRPPSDGPQTGSGQPAVAPAACC
jgi:hypothetical protein